MNNGNVNNNPNNNGTNNVTNNNMNNNPTLGNASVVNQISTQPPAKIENQTVVAGNNTPGVSKVVGSGQVPDNTVSNTNLSSTSDDVNNGPGKFKIFLLMVFFILVFGFIMFLPNISEIINTGNFSIGEKEISNGMLSCTMTKSSDNTDVVYEMNFSFTSKKLLVSNYSIITESESKAIIDDKYNECLNIQTIANDIAGIDVSCTNSGGVNTMRQSYEYNVIDNSNLIQFTEAGGTYPEYEYQDNIYDVRLNMIKAGYDCEIKAS